MGGGLTTHRWLIELCPVLISYRTYGPHFRSLNLLPSVTIHISGLMRLSFSRPVVDFAPLFFGPSVGSTLVMKSRLHWAFWLVSNGAGNNSRLHRSTVWSALGRVGNDLSAAKGLTSSLDGRVVFDATLHTVLTVRSLVLRLGHAPVFLRYSCYSSHYFRRLAVNLIILRKYS